MGSGTALPLIVGGVITIILAPMFAFVGSCVAEMKRRCKVPWLILCGLFFPALILLSLLPASTSPESFSKRFLYIIQGLDEIPLPNLACPGGGMGCC